MRIDVFIGSLINSFVVLFASSQLLKVPFSIKNRKFVLSFLSLFLAIFFCYITTQGFMRTLLVFGMMILGNYYANKNSGITFTQAVLVSLYEMLGLFVAEMLFAIIITFILKSDFNDIQKNIIGNFTCNLVVDILFLLFMICNPSKRIFRELNNKFENLKIKYLITISFLIILTLSIMCYLSYFKFSVIKTFLLNLVVICICIFITYILLKEKEKNTKVEKENQDLEKNLSEYEKMYQFQRMINHEYKNDLAIMRGLGHKNNKKLINYIDNLADIKTRATDRHLEELNRIPEGGMRGLIYYKMILMQEKRIDFDLNISRNVTMKILRNLPDDIKVDLCKILGIYIDNAIQAVEGLSKKNVQISFYINPSEKCLNITIMNSYQGTIELDKICDAGYSTKGKGRGLGLAIAQQILNKNGKIENRVKIIRNNFMQELRIKI